MDSSLDIIQLQPQIERFLNDCESQNLKQNKLRSISCPETRKWKKLETDSPATPNESLIIYKLYETARQRRTNGLKNQTKTALKQNRKFGKVAAVGHEPCQLRELDLTVTSDDEANQKNKLTEKLNFDEGRTKSETHGYFLSDTLDHCPVNEQCKSATQIHLQSTAAENRQVIEGNGANSVIKDDKKEEVCSSTEEELIGTQMQNTPNANVTSSNEASLCPPQSKRRSKVIEVDGVCYILTMEPPGRHSYRSNSLASIEVYKGLNSYYRRDAFFSRLANGAFINKEAMAAHCRLSRELNTWYQKRELNATEINLSQFGPSDVTEPYKIEALDHAALRLRKLASNLKNDLSVTKETLLDNLEYAIGVLESNYLKLNRIESEPTPPSDDEVLDNLSGETPVPEEIKSWLVETFSNKKIGGDKTRTKKEHKSLRSVVRTVQAGMMFDRISKKPANDIANEYLSPDVVRHLKNIDKWTFDVFELDSISNGNALTCVCYQLLSKYGLIKRFKISVQALFAYCNRLQKGYRKHNNRYHNPVHAADVAQTLNCLLTQSGFVNWFSDLEIFSMIMAALVHDVEHTGTTNNFHINTRSNLAILYNDRSVLEQHHVSTAFRIMTEEEGCDILANFSKDDYQDCRSLMVEMVLATDMNRHFEQVKCMETALQRPDLLERSKAMSLLLHSSDINHPSKPWKLHCKWTEKLVLEFFDQGDRERKLDLPISPLCDRHSAKIAQSQIGFIDFVVQPTFSMLLRLFGDVNNLSDIPIGDENANVDPNGDVTPSNGDILKQRFVDCEINSIFDDRDSAIETLDVLKETVFACVNHNRSQWVRKDKIETEKKLIGEKAFQVSFIADPLPPSLSKYCTNGDLCKIKEQPFKSSPRITNSAVKSKPP